MTFHARARGFTLSRAQDAIHRPHGSKERFDPEYPVVMRCSRCGKFGQGPRRNLREAIQEHAGKCPARHTKADDPTVMTILYPRI